MDLYTAANSGGRRALERLVESGTDINVLDYRGRTALSFAAEEGNEAVARLLLGIDGIDPNRVGKGGQTALLWAVKNKNDAVVELLLGVDGIDPNLRDNYGRTALLWAAKERECGSGEAAGRDGRH